MNLTKRELKVYSPSLFTSEAVVIESHEERIERLSLCPQRGTIGRGNLTKRELKGEFSYYVDVPKISIESHEERIESELLPVPLAPPLHEGISRREN